MTSWHRRVRSGFALLGIAVAAIVFFSFEEQQTAAPPAPVTRMDPKAVLETYSAIVERITGIEKNFEFASERSTTYDDGSARHYNVTILVEKNDKRTFKVTAQEAYAGKDQIIIDLKGQVRIEDSDGFWLATDAATYDRQRSLAQTAAPVKFGKGRMNGSGVGVTYDEGRNVLSIAEQPHITTVDEAGTTVMDFAAGTATLDRVQHLLTVDGAVHALRGEQVMDADRATARLSETDEIVRFLELRGNARVEGGDGRIDAMSARDIDLDYTDDGQRLEAVGLRGSAAVAMTDSGGNKQIVAETVSLQLQMDGSSTMALQGSAVVTTTAADGKDPRRIAADALDLSVAGDGTLTSAIGRENVRLDLPAAAQSPARAIRARTLDGRGKAGQGLTNATFNGDVVFTETPVGGAGTPGEGGRTARANTLDAILADDVVNAATFIGDVTFEETGLKACAGRLDYQPGKGSLALSAATAAGNPIVAEEQISVEAPGIDVALDVRRIQARGGVLMRVGGRGRCAPAAARDLKNRGPSKLPGLLKEDSPATIKAETLAYEGDAGTAIFAGFGPGRPTLSQGDLSIHADRLSLDQKAGDLTATGNALSSMVLDGEPSTGRANEIRYIDARRLVRYAMQPARPDTAPAGPPPAAPSTGPRAPGGPGQAASAAPSPAAGSAASTGPVPAPAAAVPPVTQVRVDGPQGDIRATDRIDIMLAAEGGSRVQRLEAHGGVSIIHSLETESGRNRRTVTGGSTFTYSPEDGRYVMTGTGAVPVKIVENVGPSQCREYIGRTLTFYKSSEAISIDGNDRNRTKTTPGACAAAAPVAPSR